MLKRTAALVAGLVLALGAAGCGEDKNAAYAKKVNNLITERFGARIETLASEIGASDDPGTVLKQTAVELRTLARQLSQIEPPKEELRPDIVRLQNELSSYASAIEKEAAEPDQERFAAATELAGRSIKATLSDINSEL